MKKFFGLLNRSPRRTAGVSMVLAAIMVPATLFAWGPERPLYTWQEPADHVTFNSITNNPNYGDERNFVTVKDPKTGHFVDKVNVEPGKEYTVRVLVHNNAADNYNKSGKGIALDTTLHTAISQKTGKKNAITGHVTASNATPMTVYDDVFFEASEDFNLAYVHGSARVYNSGYAKGGEGKPFSDNMITKSGAKLGFEKEGDGKIPGCFKYINYVYFNVKPQFAKKPDFTVTKKVSPADKKQFVDSMKADKGDKIQYMIEYRNTGQVQMDNVVIHDTLPEHVTYVPGTTKLLNNKHPQGKQLSDNLFTKNGLNIGSHAPNSNSYVTFEAKVNKTVEELCGVHTLVNRASATTDYGKKEDTAKVVVKQECEEPQPQPENIEVCLIDEKKIITIDKKDFDETKHSTNLADCEEEAVEKIKVCEVVSGNIVEINKEDFDSSRHSTNLDDCKKEEPVTPVTPATPETPVTPTELPQTGSSTPSALAVIGAITLSLGYVITGRKFQN